MLSCASKEGRDIKVSNTKYTNHRSIDQSHQNYAIRAEATSSSFPWQISFYHRQAERLQISRLLWSSNNRHRDGNGSSNRQSKDKYDDDNDDAFIIMTVVVVVVVVADSYCQLLFWEAFFLFFFSSSMSAFIRLKNIFYDLQPHE